jgi:undecaprenyl-diphosphatase
MRRRAALRGLASLAVASASANVPAKLMARRTRPGLDGVPLIRQLRRQPSTSSFPSGHSASAAAFTVGVALEQPLLAVPVGVLAAGVAYGRVHTGVHYPGDVVAGLAIGTGAALAVKRVWPTRPARPGVHPPTVAEAVALPDGAGLELVLNTSAGAGQQAEELTDALLRELPQAVVRAVPGEEVEPALRDAAGRARVLGVCGGDGTVNTAAGIALEAGLPLAVLPGGTLDHFARELGITGPEALAAAVREGNGVEVTVGSTWAGGDGGYFLNTFALGVYPELVVEREKREGRIGKWPAMAVAMARLVRHAEPVHVDVDGEERRLWTLFAGNGHYHPAGFAPSWRERLDDGVMDIRLVDAERPLARTRLVLAVLTGRLGASRVHEQRVVARLRVRSREGARRMAHDGEVKDGPERLLLRAASRTLVVYRPTAG